MADVTITGLTAARMKEIEAASIVDARLQASGSDMQLILKTKGGTEINLGNIRGPQGVQGPGGAVTSVNSKTGSSITLNAADVGAATPADLAAATVPSGTVVMTARSTAPTGYLLCQGQMVSKTTYANLFAAIGSIYGPTDTNNFTLPNLRGRAIMGMDSSQTEFDTLGETGGSKTVTITIDQMPTHSHEIDNTTARVTATNSFDNRPSITDDNGGGSVAAGTAGGRYGKSIRLDATTKNTGNGQPTPVLQPYMVLNYMIKA